MFFSFLVRRTVKLFWFKMPEDLNAVEPAENVQSKLYSLR